MKPKAPVAPSLSLWVILTSVAAAAPASGPDGAPPAGKPPANPGSETTAAPSAARESSSLPTAIDREIASLRTVAQQSGPPAAVFVRLGNALMQKLREAPESRLLEEAEAAFRRALSMESNNAQAMAGLAWVYNSRHEFDVGTCFACEALAADPQNQHACALLGDASVERGDYDDAFEHYQRALDLLPDLSSYSRAARLMWLTGDARKAQWLMQKAIAAGGPFAENTAWCRAELALMSFHTGALLLAEREAEAALKLAPRNHRVLTVMGRIVTARMDYPSAIDYYRRAIDQVPDHETLVALGDLNALMGEREAAERAYLRVVQLHAPGAASADGTGPPARHSRYGNAQLARFYADHDRNLDDALREAKAACTAFPNVYAIDTLAWCYHKKGKSKEAEETVRQALKWKTPDAEIHFHAGMIYAARCNRPEAQKHLYRALSLNPRFHPVFAQTAVDTLASLSATPAAAPQ